MQLPADVQRVILNLLSPSDRALSRLVCSAWRRYIRAPRKITLAHYVNNLEVLIWARHNKCPLEYDTLRAAAKGGYLDVLQYLDDHGFNLNCSDSILCTDAASNGHVEILQWLRQKGCQLNHDVAINASRDGHLHVLKWVFSFQYESFYLTRQSIAAAQGGHLHILEWLQSEGYFQIGGAAGLIDSILCGHLDIAKWFIQNGYYLTTSNHEICSAARLGYLEIVKLLHAKGMLYNELTCSAAVIGDHLETLQWLRANGCPWWKQECYNLAKSDEMRDWINAQPD
jgi:F-box domain